MKINVFFQKKGTPFLCNLLSIAVVLSLVACNKIEGNYKLEGNYELDAASFTPDKIKLVEEKTGLTFPAEARGLNMHYDATSGIDPSFVAKIEIPTSQSEAFKSNLETFPVRDSYIDDSYTKGINWWHPQTKAVIAKRFIIPQHGGGWTSVLYCDENGKRLAYIIWSN